MKKFFLAFISCFILSISVLSCTLPHPSTFAYVNSVHNREETPAIVQKIWIDNSFGEADMVEIQNALDQWTYALNGYMTFEMEEFDVVNGSLQPFRECYAGQSWCFLKINHTSSMLLQHDRPDLGTWTLAFCDRVGGHLMYVVRDRVENDQMKGLIMHEIGHLLGAVHYDEDSDLMAPMFTNENTNCIDKHTLEQVAAFERFPAKNMNYCVYSDITKKSKSTVASQGHSVD